MNGTCIVTDYPIFAESRGVYVRPWKVLKNLEFNYILLLCFISDLENCLKTDSILESGAWD